MSLSFDGVEGACSVEQPEAERLLSATFAVDIDGTVEAEGGSSKEEEEEEADTTALPPDKTATAAAYAAVVACACA